MEIATALAQQKRVVPVLVDGARMPERHTLPPDIAAMADVSPLPLRPDPDFDSDMRAIIAACAPAVRRRLPHAAMALCGLLALMAIAPNVLTDQFLGSRSSAVDLVLNSPELSFRLIGLEVVGDYLLVLGCMLVAVRAWQTRAWAWLGLGLMLGALILAGVSVYAGLSDDLTWGLNGKLLEVSTGGHVAGIRAIRPAQTDELRRVSPGSPGTLDCRACGIMVGLLTHAMVITGVFQGFAARGVFYGEDFYFDALLGAYPALFTLSVAASLVGAVTALVVSAGQHRRRWQIALPPLLLLIIGSLLWLRSSLQAAGVVAESLLGVFAGPRLLAAPLGVRALAAFYVISFAMAFALGAFALGTSPARRPRRAAQEPAGTERVQDGIQLTPSPS